MVSPQIIESFVKTKFDFFGVNKRQEVVRLLYEIAKRDGCDFQDILKDVPEEEQQFIALKRYLLKRRYPNYTARTESFRHLLPKLEIDPALKVNLQTDIKVLPQQFFVEQAVLDSNLVKRLRNKFPEIPATTIPSYKDYVRGQRFDISAYNNRLKSIFLVKEEYDFYKHCACSPKSVHCGYHIVNLGSGCAFECSYCYLQDYINSPGIVLPANIEDFFTQFEHYKQNIRIGSGELTDSLVFDHITEFSPLIVGFFKRHPQSTFEFKTKSNNVGLLTSVRSGGNIVVSWSMNPQRIICATEFYTASLDERLAAAVQCVAAGYKVAFHFDPIIYYSGWQNDYKGLVNQIFDTIAPEHIAWLSLGTLRMTPRLKRIIENRFPENSILDEEFLLSHDGKLRYGFKARTEIYKKMQEWIRQRSKDVYIYLCMEEKSACVECQTPPLKQYKEN